VAKRWHVAHVYSVFGKNIAQQIKGQASEKDLADEMDEVTLPLSCCHS